MTDSARGAPPAWRRRLYLPAYHVSEAARLAEISPQTVASWHAGRRAMFRQAKTPRMPLSYLQLVETAFVATFRSLGFSLKRIRDSHDYLAKAFHSEYPFAELELQTDGLHILKEFEVAEGLRKSLVLADAGSQLMWPELVMDRIYQFEYDLNIAIRWHPRGRTTPIVVDPRIAFGAPMIEGTGIATWVVRERYEAGESLSEIKEDFDLEASEILQALRFEGIEAPLAA